MLPKEASFYLCVTRIFHLMVPVFESLVGGAFLQVHTDLHLVSIYLSIFLNFCKKNVSAFFNKILIFLKKQKVTPLAELWISKK